MLNCNSFLLHIIYKLPIDDGPTFHRNFIDFKTFLRFLEPYHAHLVHIYGNSTYDPFNAPDINET